MRRILDEKQTEYGLLQVEDRDGIRYLLVNHEMESAFSLKEDHELLFPYMRQFSYAFSINPAISSCLLIGGGACAYPMFYLRQYLHNTIDVVEISADILAYARRYFHLERIENSARLHIYQMDASVFLTTSEKKYDLIINDAFIGRGERLRTADHMREIHEHLNKNGIYLMNLVSAIKGPFSSNLRRTQEAMRTCFRDSVYLPCSDMYTAYEKQNLVLAGSDRIME